MDSRYTRWRDARAAHAWSHPSWDQRLVFFNGPQAPQLTEQREIAKGYLGDGEKSELLTFRLIPIPATTVLFEFDG